MDLDRIARTTASTVARVTRAALGGEDEAAVSNHAAQDGLVESGEADPAETAPSPLTGRQVGVLASFGIGPENLDDEAQARMAQAIGRLDGMFAGPGADGSDREILLEEADYTLSLRTAVLIATMKTLPSQGSRQKAGQTWGSTTTAMEI